MNTFRDPALLRRRVITGQLDVHPTEMAIVVNYSLEASLLGDLGDPITGNRKECQKVIRVRSMTAQTDAAVLAAEIVDKCELIHSSKIKEVEHLLNYLKDRHKDDYGRQSSATSNPDKSHSSEVEIARISHLDEYVELLYEDLPDKLKASNLILQLARNPNNLEELAANEIVLGALARVLREDMKRSLELSHAIVYIFFCFSVYTQFHCIISLHKLGSVVMEIIDYELNRYNQWKQDLDVKKRQSESSVSSDDAKLNGYDRALKRFQGLQKKQDQLLQVSFYLLLNIAEDQKTEEKMRRKQLIPLLVAMLQRENNDTLLTLVITFLKKLSIYMENIDDMCGFNVVEKISKIINSFSNFDLTDVTIRLLYNLSFDTRLRARMVRANLLPKLVPFIDNEQHKSPVIGLLYHLSMDDRCKSTFSYTDCIKKVKSMILDSPTSKADFEVVALAINLAANKRNAQHFADEDGLKKLFTRAFKYQDSLIMKLIRNIAQFDGPTKIKFVEYVTDLSSAIHSASSEEFVLECVGILSSLTIPELDYGRLVEAWQLLPWIEDKISTTSHCEDDLLLEVIVLLGTLSMDSGCADLLCDANIPGKLIEQLRIKQEDDEMVLQIIYAFYQLCRHDKPRDHLLQHTDAGAYILDLLQDQNSQIRKVCDATLDIIAEHDPSWGEKIRLAKFRHHNMQWLDMIEDQAVQELQSYDETDDYHGFNIEDPNLLETPEYRSISRASSASIQHIDVGNLVI